MWTLILRAEINDDFTVTKHIHLLRKDLKGNTNTIHKQFKYDSFVDVAKVISTENLDVSRYYKEDIETQLTNEELNNKIVVDVLKMFNSYNAID